MKLDTTLLVTLPAGEARPLAELLTRRATHLLFLRHLA